MPRNVVLFTHIGKTAGSSLHEVLKSKFASSEIVAHGIERDFFYGINDLSAGTTRCVLGHFGYGLHRLLPSDRVAQYVTLLRDPFERLLSLYSYRPEIKERYATPLDYILDPGRPCNIMCLHVSGFDCEPTARFALKRLAEDYACFGITERFNESVDWISAVLDLGTPTYPKINVTENKAVFEVALRAQWRQAMSKTDAEDFALFNGACDLFESRRLIEAVAMDGPASPAKVWREW